MDDTDRELVVATAETLLGPAARTPTWPWLRDDEGRLLQIDGWWPDHGLAIAILDTGADRWRFARGPVEARGATLVGLDPDAFPRDADGRLEPTVLRTHLFALVSPNGRERLQVIEAIDLPLSPHGPRPWETASSEWFEMQAGHDVDAASLEPWEPGEPSFADDEADPWGEADADRYGFDASLDYELDDGTPPLDLGWRLRPVALAALESAVLARRVLGTDAIGAGDPTAFQVLVAVTMAADAVGHDSSTPRGLATRLDLPEHVVVALLARLVDTGLLEPGRGDDDHPWSRRPTEAGRRAVAAWVARIEPWFGPWPPRDPGVDDTT